MQDLRTKLRTATAEKNQCRELQQSHSQLQESHGQLQSEHSALEERYEDLHWTYSERTGAVRIAKEAQEEHAMQVEASVCSMHAYLTAVGEADALLKKNQAEHEPQHKVGCLKPIKPERD